MEKPTKEKNCTMFLRLMCAGRFFSVNEDEKRKGRDIMWYIWAAPNSPLFGKDKMTTFERYFVKDKETHKETKNAYYHLLGKMRKL